MVINYRRRSLWLVRVLGGPYESGIHDLCRAKANRLPHSSRGCFQRGTGYNGTAMQCAGKPGRWCTD